MHPTLTKPRLTLILVLVLGLLLPASHPLLAQTSATIHYHRAAGDYAGWGLHVWDGAAQETQWGEPLATTGIDDFGVFWEVPLAAGAQELDFIIHKGDEKDPGPDQSLDLAQSAAAWIVSGSPTVYLTVVDPNEVATGLPVTEEPQPTQPVTSVSFPGDYAPTAPPEAAPVLATANLRAPPFCMTRAVISTARRMALSHSAPRSRYACALPPVTSNTCRCSLANSAATACVPCP